MKKNIFLKSERGLTFTEVIISIGVFSMVMLGVTELFIKSWQNYNLVMHTNEASIAANRGVSEMVNVLRRIGDGADGSYAILTAANSELRVFCDIDKDGVIEKVHYYLNGTDLMVGTSNPNATFPVTYPSGDSEVDVLIGNVVNSVAQPLFYYYDDQNATIASPGSNLNNIRMIEVNLFIDRREGDLNIESYASLRNLSENDTIE